MRVIGTRHGEKLYEALLSREERAAAEDLGGYFRVPPDGRDLNYGKFVEQGDARIEEAAGLQLPQHRAPGHGRHEGTLLLKLDFMKKPRLAARHAVTAED